MTFVNETSVPSFVYCTQAAIEGIFPHQSKIKDFCQLPPREAFWTIIAPAFSDTLPIELAGALRERLLKPLSQRMTQKPAYDCNRRSVSLFYEYPPNDGAFCL